VLILVRVSRDLELCLSNRHRSHLTSS
jgi:hypothetical protein